MDEPALTSKLLLVLTLDPSQTTRDPGIIKTSKLWMVRLTMGPTGLQYIALLIIQTDQRGQPRASRER